jgi:hypothetical protein
MTDINSSEIGKALTNSLFVCTACRRCRPATSLGKNSGKKVMNPGRLPDGAVQRITSTGMCPNKETLTKD